MAGGDEISSLAEGLKGLNFSNKALLKDLIIFLNDNKMIASKNHIKIRERVLYTLEKLVTDWAKEYCLNRGMPRMFLKNCTFKVLPFGSFYMGIHWHGGDLDLLCISPRFINRCDFFKSFLLYLKQQEFVTDVMSVENAFCPVIKMKCLDIEVDMLFASLDIDCITPNLDLNNDRLLFDMDMSCIRSLHGYRVTTAILSLVPSKANFRMLLRIIKLWAKRRGIYSNSLGFLGGAAYAILAAYICIHYADDDVITLLEHFFSVYVNWGWNAAHPTPIKLKDISTYDIESIPVWNPNQNLLDRFHIMPIITPSFPEKNCAYNVTQSSRKIILEELKIGLANIKDILGNKSKWPCLFEPLEFFDDEKHFLVVMARSQSDNHKTWAGLIEAKIRILVNNLDQSEKIEYVRVLPENYSIFCEGKHFSKWYLSMKILKPRAPATTPHLLNLSYDIRNFEHVVMSSARRLKEYTEDMTFEVISLTRTKRISSKFIKTFLPPDFTEASLKNAVIEDSSIFNCDFEKDDNFGANETVELADMKTPEPVSYMNQNKMLQLKLLDHHLDLTP